MAEHEHRYQAVMLISTFVISVLVLIAMLINRYQSGLCHEWLIGSSGLMLFSIFIPTLKKQARSFGRFIIFSFILYFTLAADIVIYAWLISSCTLIDIPFSFFYLLIPLAGLIGLLLLAPKQ